MYENDNKSMVYTFIIIASVMVLIILVAVIVRQDDIAPATNIEYRTVGRINADFTQENISIVGDNELRRAMPQTYRLVQDRVLEERYNAEKIIEKHASLVGNTIQDGNNLSFQLQFAPSNSSYWVTVQNYSSPQNLNVITEKQQ